MLPGTPSSMVSSDCAFAAPFKGMATGRFLINVLGGDREGTWLFAPRVRDVRGGFDPHPPAAPVPRLRAELDAVPASWWSETNPFRRTARRATRRGSAWCVFPFAKLVLANGKCLLFF